MNQRVKMFLEPNTLKRVLKIPAEFYEYQPKKPQLELGIKATELFSKK